MVDESGIELKDYKFFCFNGEPKLLFIATDRAIKDEPNFDFFDLEFNHLPIIKGHPNSKKPISKPPKFEEMIEIARELSKCLPHVRVDLFNVNGIIYVGEMTFFHFSGLVKFEPDEWDFKLGEMLKIPSL
jgi:glycosyltransferase